MNKVRQNFKADLAMLKKINKELDAIKQLLDLQRAMTDDNKNAILAQMIHIVRSAPSAETLVSDWQVEWFIVQAYNNTLSDKSSGSFRTALGDIDNIAASLLDEDHERYEEHYKLLEQQYEKIIAPIF